MKRRDLYNDLGVDKNATDEEIKQAYRKKAMESHPDRNGGRKEAEEEFKAIAIAYAVLSNREKRRRYDNGEDPTETPIENEAMGIAVSAFMNALQNFLEDYKHTDLIKEALKDIKVKAQKIRQNINTMKKVEKTYIKVEKRLKKRSQKGKARKGDDILNRVLKREINNLQEMQANDERKGRILDEATKILNDYEYDFENQEDIVTFSIAGHAFRINNRGGF